MMFADFSDFRQIAMVAKNELIKGMRGKKFLVSFIIILIVFGLITVMPYVTGSGWDGKSSGEILSAYLSNLSMIVLLIVALLSSVAIVSEFEERTALILFTRPIRRTSIFLGKVLFCFIIEALIVLVYYLLVLGVLLIFVGEVPLNLGISLAFALLYIFATSGIAFVISSFIKKGSVCTIITLLVLVMIIPLVTKMINGNTWYMLDTAGNTIITCIPEYVESFNQAINQWIVQMQTAIDYLETSSDPIIKQVAQFMQMMVDTHMYGFMAPIATPNILREAGVLLVWGVAAYIISWVKFIRREF